jgi:hypothetical protein
LTPVGWHLLAATSASMMCCLSALRIFCCCGDYLSLDAGGMVLQTQPRRRCLHYCELSHTYLFDFVLCLVLVDSITVNGTLLGYCAVLVCCFHMVL